MKDKLLSILQAKKGQKGFTLVELLVVIAIIAILVLIVIVAIDPIQRIHDASDRRAEADVRQTASAIEGCLANATNATTITNCDDGTALTASGTPGGPWIRVLPAGIVIASDPGPPVALPITVCSVGGAGHRAFYSTATGVVAHEATATC